MNLADSLISLSLEEAKQFLANQGITDYQIVYYTDRKQQSFDKYIVVRVTKKEDKYILLVCPMQMHIQSIGE